MASSGTSFARVRVRAADARRAERAAAEAFAAGAAGLEERAVDRGIELLVYAAADAVAGVRAALAALAREEGLDVEAPEAVRDTDWSEAWRRELEAIEISDRLVVRPSFVSHRPAPGQAELLIDPGQAFGTGSHESTRLALEWVSELAPALGAGARVLDVGVGSGVLALAAARLARVRAVGCDLDPLAGEAARSNARANALADRLQCFTGGIDALAPGARFELVLANLLRRELLPILPALATRVARPGAAVLSGLLESEEAQVLAAAARQGLCAGGRRRRVDASGVAWVALRLVPDA